MRQVEVEVDRWLAFEARLTAHYLDSGVTRRLRIGASIDLLRGDRRILTFFPIT